MVGKMNLVYEDAFNMLCGDLLGEGIHRKVFECKIRPDLVVKVESDTTSRYFANVLEMKFWCDISTIRKSRIGWHHANSCLQTGEFFCSDGVRQLVKRSGLRRYHRS